MRCDHIFGIAIDGSCNCDKSSFNSRMYSDQYRGELNHGNAIGKAGSSQRRASQAAWCNLPRGVWVKAAQCHCFAYSAGAYKAAGPCSLRSQIAPSSS